MQLYRTVIGLGLFVAVLSVLGLIIPPGYSAFTIILPSGGDAFFTLLAGCSLLVMGCSAYFYSLRHLRAYSVLAGCTLIALALLGIFFPDDLATVGAYARPANVMLMLTAGLSFLLVTLELDRTTSQLALLARPASQVRTKRMQLSQLQLVDVVKNARPRLTSLQRGWSTSGTILSTADLKMRAYSSRFASTLYWQMLRQYYAQHFGRVRVWPVLRSS